MATPKKLAAPAPTPVPTPAPGGDPMTELTARLKAEAERAKAGHLATYRAGVNALAAGRALAPEEEPVFAAALSALAIDTDQVGRDAQMVRTVEALKKNLGATEQERAVRSSELAVKVKASADALDKLRAALKLAEATHNQTAGQELGFGGACAELNRLERVNARLFADDWPAPKPDPNAPIRANPMPMAPPPPPPPPVTSVYHPWLAKVVPITPEKHAELSGMAPSPNTPLHQQSAVDRLVEERASAAADAETARRMKESAVIEKQLNERRAALEMVAAAEKPAPAEAPAG